jgi:hypothetical protein
MRRNIAKKLYKILCQYIGIQNISEKKEFNVFKKVYRVDIVAGDLHGKLSCWKQNRTETA